jgi:hypothetical protein
MTIEPGSPNPESANAEIDAFFSALFGDSFAELDDPSERRQLVGVSRALREALAFGPLDAAPRADLQSRTLEAIRSEARATAPSAQFSSTTANAIASPTIEPPRTASVRQSLAGRLKRFRGRIVLVLVALVAAVTALFSSFGSSPVVAASAVLAPNPGSPTPTASGTADFLSPKKGAKINKVEMKVKGLTPTTGETEYQCWLVGPGDSPSSPNRILVGTFSTKDGTADIDWKAADYSPEFAQLDISLEKKDGNPDYGGVTVLSTIKYNGKRTG